MDFRERVTPPHCRLQLWFALVGFLIPWSQAGKPCELRPEQFRSSLVLQGVQFDGAYALSLHEGLDCLREITTPRGPVNQSLNAIADFYEQFYAFRYICIDPPASSQSQAAPFDFGVYGSPRGGGSSAKDAKIDIVGELRSLAASLPENPGIDQWFLRSNSLFTRLRDAHVDWRNGGTKADTVLNQFIFILQNDATTSPVRMEVSARSAAAVDGFADPRFSCDGMEIESIDGMKPMQWLQLHVLENPAFHYAYKSLGSRANRMLKSARVGFAWLGSRVGDVSSLTPSVEVRFKNGQTTTWSWTWLLLTRSLNACKKYDVNCVLDLLKGPLKAAGTLHQNAVEALGQLQKAHQHDELVNAAPELPDDEMMKLLKEDTGLRSFLKIPEERIPGTQAHYGAMLESRPALDEASFPRRWLLDPALSPLGATYGYYQLQRDESGELFAVVKLTRFYLTEDESAGFQVQSQFTAFWRELVQTSKDHSVSRLLVDLSGNPGGFVDFAYLFVRALHPLLQFAEVCNEYDRPVGSLFHAWKHVNVTPLVNFLKTVAPAEKRVEELSEEKKEHLTQILHAVTKACIAMDVLSYDDYMMIQSAIDTLDMGEMDAYTLQETVQVLSDSAASFGMELCCNGHVVPKVGNRTRCCGDNSFDPWSEMCCDDTTNTILPRMTQPTCCGSDLYDAASDMCCGTTVFYRVPTRGVPKTTLGCCGDQGYDTTQQICCEENLSPIPRTRGALPGCCGSRGYDAATQICCDGRPRYKPGNMSACCSNHAYNIGTQLCCNNQYVVHKGGSNSACCGNYLSYNPGTQLCCNGFPQSNRNPFTGGLMLCCDGVMQPKISINTACCGTRVYDPVSQICCDGRIPVSKWAFGGGCGGLA